MPQVIAKNNDFLVEIHTEELPPKTLFCLAEGLLTEIKTRLDKLELGYQDACFYATPRRLAVFIKKLATKQAEAIVERKGPKMSAAFDKEGKPTSACVGFARSLGMLPEQLITIKDHQGEWVGYQQTVAGKSTQDILPALVQQALLALPIQKRMRWGNGNVEFVRPVHSVMMLYGDEVIDAEILGCRAGRLTHGHRFHSKGWISILKPSRYVAALEKKYVIADFIRRKEIIRAEAQQAVHFLQDATVFLDENLLNEVAGLVEWPVALCGNFAKTFLTLPPEVLISAMQDHQRYFPVMNQHKQLLPYFVTISNIKSLDAKRVMTGNEQVLRARLSDAAFFFATDKKQKLSERLESLKQVIFQAKLGTLYDKAQRISRLAAHIATLSHVNPTDAERAGMLAKTDLTTTMVNEFPELQGVMGYYYALHDGEHKEIALALNEQYMPRFSGDALPATALGQVLALADRLDTLVGIFGIHQAPTGDKDPFALRRAALGILRILIEKQFNLDLHELVQVAAQGYANSLENKKVVIDVLQFILERLKPWYQDQGISADVLASVAALAIYKPYDIHQRIQAVQHFKNLPEAAALCAANKRVSNILAKSNSEIKTKHVDEKLFEHEAEQILVMKLMEKCAVVKSLSEQGNYTEVLTQLASLREPVDNFFDHVMVMSDDQARRENRLWILKQLRELFLNVADVALLQ